MYGQKESEHSGTEQKLWIRKISKCISPCNIVQRELFVIAMAVFRGEISYGPKKNIVCIIPNFKYTFFSAALTLIYLIETMTPNYTEL